MNPKFPNVANCLSINFLNTRLSRNNKIIELLSDKHALSSWIENELQQPTKYTLQLNYLKKNLDSLNLEELIKFRNSLYGLLFDYSYKKEQLTDITTLIEKHFKKQPILVAFNEHHERFFVPTSSGNTFFISLILLDVSNLIDEGSLTYLKHCSNSECVLLFFDKTGRRKWCSMKICGNRKKVEKYIKQRQLEN